MLFLITEQQCLLSAVGMGTVSCNSVCFNVGYRYSHRKGEKSNKE